MSLKSNQHRHHHHHHHQQQQQQQQQEGSMKVLRRKANACHREAKNCEFKFFIEEKLC